MQLSITQICNPSSTCGSRWVSRRLPRLHARDLEQAPGSGAVRKATPPAVRHQRSNEPNRPPLRSSPHACRKAAQPGIIRSDTGWRRALQLCALSHSEDSKARRGFKSAPGYPIPGHGTGCRHGKSGMCGHLTSGPVVRFPLLQCQVDMRTVLWYFDFFGFVAITTCD
jgi:hypothetical protein